MTLIDTEENILLEAESKVIKPNPHSIGLRTSLPKEIASVLNIGDQEILKYKVITKNDAPYVIIEKKLK